MIDRIQARRAALIAQLAQAQQQYDQLEQTLRQLDRQLCAMHGGMQELDALVAAERSSTERSSTYATGLNGTHEAALESQSPPVLSGDPIGDGADIATPRRSLDGALRGRG